MPKTVYFQEKNGFLKETLKKENKRREHQNPQTGIRKDQKNLKNKSRFLTILFSLFPFLPPPKKKNHIPSGFLVPFLSLFIFIVHDGTLDIYLLHISRSDEGGVVEISFNYSFFCFFFFLKHF